MAFPIAKKEFILPQLSRSAKLSSKKKEELDQFISLSRMSLVYFTALAQMKGLGGHTGGAYDIIPEMSILQSFASQSATIYPYFFDSAGHRVAIHYLWAALFAKGKDTSSLSDLEGYRAYKKGLPGHPERNDKKGIHFSSGRLGHMWSHVNGVAEREKGKTIVLFESDGSLQEGNTAEAALYAATKQLNIFVVVDVNDVTIEDKPSAYLNGFSLKKWFKGYGFRVEETPGEDTQKLTQMIQELLSFRGPRVLLVKRKIAPRIPVLEDSVKAHDVIPYNLAQEYFAAYEGKGKEQVYASQFLNALIERKKEYDEKKEKKKSTTSPQTFSLRKEFGTIVCDLLSSLSKKEQQQNLVISSDLGGSVGIASIKKQFPEIYRHGGIVERHNFLACAGFGDKKGYQGIYSTFAAFSEMVLSEITMSSLNNANVLAHFSHSGVNGIADNTCHFGINGFLTLGGFSHQQQVYFPADVHQLRSCVNTLFFEQGLRFVFTYRSSLPLVLDTSGKPYYKKGKKYSQKADIIRPGKNFFVVSYGDVLHEVLAAVDSLAKEKGISLGVINKHCMQFEDKEIIKKLVGSKKVFVAESQSEYTGLGSKLGSTLLSSGFKGKYMHKGVKKYGLGGVKEQVAHQGLDSKTLRQDFLSFFEK